MKMEKKKIFISKIGIMFALIFSFLFSLVSNNATVFAASENETIRDTVEVIETTRENNVINFILKERLDVKSITYQFSYTADNGVKYAELVVDGKVTKVSDYKYSFNVSDSVSGIKIWKVKYAVTSDYYKDKMTTGSNYVGDYNTYYKKNYVEVISDKLEYIDGCYNETFIKTCNKTYVFYFNLDTEIDEIVNLSLEYSIKSHKKTWWGLSTSDSVKSYEVKLDQNQNVLDVENPALKTYVTSSEYANKVKNIDSSMTEEEIMNYLFSDYMRPVLGSNQKDNNYDWYVQPLLDVQLVDKKYALGSGEQEQVLQEVAIIKMSYITHGEYFEDVPVLDEDTGWVKFKSEESNKLKDFLIWLWNLIKEYWYIAIPIIFVVMIFLPTIIKYLIIGIVKVVKYLVIYLFKGIKFIITLPFKLFKGKETAIDKDKKKELNKYGYNRNSNYYKR